jgi:hypothetical protein
MHASFLPSFGLKKWTVNQKGLNDILKKDDFDTFFIFIKYSYTHETIHNASEIYMHIKMRALQIHNHKNRERPKANKEDLLQ